MSFLTLRLFEPCGRGRHKECLVELATYHCACRCHVAHEAERASVEVGGLRTLRDRAEGIRQLPRETRG